MTHIEIKDRQVTIDHVTTVTMSPDSEATVQGVTLRCDQNGIINVVACESGSYSLHQTIGHLTAGSSVTGAVHRRNRRSASGTPLWKPRPESGTPLPGPGAPTEMDAAQFPKINALPPDRLLYMIETVSAAQVMLGDHRSAEAVDLVNKMADQLGIREEINAAILKFLRDDGEHQ